MKPTTNEDVTSIVARGTLLDQRVVLYSNGELYYQNTSTKAPSDLTVTWDDGSQSKPKQKLQKGERT